MNINKYNVIRYTKTSAISLKNALNKSDLFMPRHHVSMRYLQYV
jgi:hypothetical protein